MGDVPLGSSDDEPVSRIDDPEQLCNVIAAIVETLEENELLDEDEASELRTDVYSSVKLVGLPEEAEAEDE